MLSLRVCKSAGLQVCKSAGLQVYRSASLQSASLQSACVAHGFLGDRSMRGLQVTYWLDLDVASTVKQKIAQNGLQKLGKAVKTQQTRNR